MGLIHNDNTTYQQGIFSTSKYRMTFKEYNNCKGCTEYVNMIIIS